MPNFLNQTGMSLLERLKLHTGFPVAVRSKDLAAEPGGLEHVGKQFMKVNGKFYVPSVLDEIVLLGYYPETKGSPAVIRSVMRGTFRAGFLRTGVDFVELLTGPINGMPGEWLLIPLNRIVSIEPIPT